MRQVCITGIHSYVGNALEQYLLSLAGQENAYEIRKVSLRQGVTEEVDFTHCDSVVHVAGIAHADISGVSDEEKAGYYAVNCDLAYETAKKAKEQGVGQFIYMSSVIVYGDSARVGRSRHITAKTPPAPSNFYGDSKWKAEQRLNTLQSESFRVAIVRAPMIYGAGSKGNFPLLCKFAKHLFIFPRVRNSRSMLYVENLSEFLRRLIDSGEGGLFFPQNAEYSVTSKLVQALRLEQGKRMYLSVLLGALVSVGAGLPGGAGRVINKAFGSLTIDQALSNEKITGYQLYSLEESIRRISKEQRDSATTR